MSPLPSVFGCENGGLDFFGSYVDSSDEDSSEDSSEWSVDADSTDTSSSVTTSSDNREDDSSDENEDHENDESSSAAEDDSESDDLHSEDEADEDDEEGEADEGGGDEEEIDDEDEADDDDEEDQSDEDSDDEDDDSSEGEDLEDDNEIDFKKLVADMIVTLRSDTNITRKAMRRIMKNCDIFLEAQALQLQRKVSRFLTENNLHNFDWAPRLLNLIQTSHPFKGSRSDTAQISTVKRYYRYLSPSSEFLGLRPEQVNVGRNVHRQRPVRENFQYVSVIDILSLYLSKPEVMNYLRTRRPSEDDIMTSYMDGEQFANHPFFSRHQDAFQLMLYFDELEVVNAQGTKCGIHTLGCFYVKAFNVPPHLNSKLDGIHVLALAHDDDISSYGLDTILEPFLQDLRRLESEEGVPIFVNGNRFILRASIAAFCADSKAAHRVFGLLACSARHFCRLCHISRQQLHNGHPIFGERRTEELHNQQMLRIQENPRLGRTESGIEEESCLHASRYFRYWNNMCFDPFHDFAEGTIPMEIRLVLKRFICTEGLFRCVDLNRRLRAFNFGKHDKRSKPSANFTAESLNNAERAHNLKQTGCQTLCLLRVLPFLLDGLVPHDDPHMQLLLILGEITGIVLAPKISRTIIPYLQVLIREHMRLFRRLFPTVQPINKHHHMEHYPECILASGPSRTYWCAREEAKHRPLRRHVVSCNNYINVPVTAIEFAQLQQAKTWGTDSDIVFDKIKFNTRIEKPVQDLPTADLLRANGYNADDAITTTEEVSVHGIDYGIGEFVMIESGRVNPDGLHQFGKIVGILVVENNSRVYLEIERRNTEGFDDDFNAYVVSQEIVGIELIDPEAVPFHPPLSIWSNYTTPHLFLSLQHYVP